MKYMLSWFERPQGSPAEYENAQKRILEVFTQWKAPGNFKIEVFVIRVGDWGGYMLLDCDEVRSWRAARCCSPQDAQGIVGAPISATSRNRGYQQRNEFNRDLQKSD